MYVRMLAGWADSQLLKLLKSIFLSGMESIAVNQAYNSIIGWVKDIKMYGES